LGDIKPYHHAAEHVNREGNPGSTYRAAVHIIHQDEIDRRVVDLHHSQRPVGVRKGAMNRCVLIAHRRPPLASAKHLFGRQRLDAPANGAGIWVLEARIATAAYDLLIGIGHGALLGMKIDLVNRRREDGLDIGGKPMVSRPNATLCRDKGGKPTATSIVLQPAV